MALPASGAISLNDVNVELGLSGTATISMNDTAVRTLFGISSGAIDMNTGHGKANQFSFTIASNQVQASLSTLGTNAGWNGSSKLVATINSGVYIYSNSTGTPALTVSGSFPGDVSLTNNGIILGCGGNGGNGGNPGSGGGSGAGGGTALSVSSPITITNNNTVAGGGGGGGGGGSYTIVGNRGVYLGEGGGGGGGGIGNSSGGSGTGGGGNGNGGGAGGAGSLTSAGGGGTGGYQNTGSQDGGSGGAGGGYGSSGSGGNNGVYPGGNGSPATYSGGSGGGSGSCTSGNSNITWSVTGNRYGALN